MSQQPVSSALPPLSYDEPIVVVALVATSESRAWIVRALSDRAHVIISYRANVALRALDGHDAAALLVDVCTRDDDGRERFIETVRRKYPHLPVVCVAKASPEGIRRLFLAARARPTAVAICPTDDCWSIVARHTRRAYAPADLLRSALAVQMDAIALPIVAYAIERFDQGITVEHLARAFAISRKTIDRRFAKSSLPPPRRVLKWLQLAGAAYHIGRSTLKMAAIADRVGFSSAATLRRSLQQLIGLSPTALKSRGGFAWYVANTRDSLLRSARVLR